MKIDKTKESAVFSAYYDNHKTLIHFRKQHGIEGYIAIHRKAPSFPSFGATRLYHYEDRSSALQDVLRLSELMSYKSAMAGLKCGGAKAVLLAPLGVFNRKKILTQYSAELNLLRGSFITGTDLGLFQDDLLFLRKKTKFVVGFKDDVSYATALGLLKSIKYCVKRFLGSDELIRRRFAIQGLGKVGYGLLDLLIKAGAEKVIVADFDRRLTGMAKKEYKGRVDVVPTGQILKQKVDVLSPCGLSNAFTMQSVKQVRCKIIVGGANNQLESLRVGDALLKSGIVYAPDYIVNAGGLISVYYEYANFGTNNVLKQIDQIPKTLNRVINVSNRMGVSPARVANDLAKKIINKYE